MATTDPFYSNLDLAKLGILQQLDLTPKYETYTDAEGETRQRPIDNTPAGYNTSYNESDAGRSVSGYDSPYLTTVNGIPLKAYYDANGTLSYIAGDSLRNLGGANRLSAQWDASGNAAPQAWQQSQGGGGVLGSIMSDPVLGTIANLGAAYFGGPLGSAALAAAQGKSPEDIAKSAALSYGAGQIASGVNAVTDSPVLSQFAGGTGAGLLSGQDLGTSLTNAAINTGANQAASGLLSSSPTQSDSYTYTPSSAADYTGADYGYNSGTSGEGLQANLAPYDSSNPYSLESSNTGGLGFQANLAPSNPSNPYSLETNFGNQDSMGGGTGIQVPSQPNATLGSIGASATANETQPSGNPTDNTAGTGLLAGLIKSIFTGSSPTGAGNMATTDTNNLLGSLLGGALTSAGGLMQGNTSAAASQAQANALRQAGTLAQQQSQFRPVGTTTNFGTSSFQIDPTTGQLTGAGYQLSPQLQSMQNTLMGNNTQSLNDAAQLQALGRSYIGQNPNDVASSWYNQQQALLAPSRDTESARLANQLQQTGRTGVSVAQGGNLGAANPETQALLNARAMADAQMAANAQQYGQQQVNFGQGLLSGAYQPFNAGLSASSNVEQLGQQPLTISSGLAQQSSASGARAGTLGLNANQAAAQAALNAGQYNPYATALSGAGNSSLFGRALGNVVGNTGVGSALGNWLSNLGGNNLNNAASSFISQNPDIIPASTFTGGTDGMDPELQALLGL